MSAIVGLKRMVVTCLVLMGILNISTVLATDTTSLMAFRVCTGIVLGGIVPPTISLTVEYVPSRYRASAVAILYLGTTFGFLLSGWAAWIVVPTLGWHAALVVAGIIPLLSCLLIAVVWPESLEFLINRSGRAGAARARSILLDLDPTLPLDAGTILVAGRTPRAPISLGELFRNGRTAGTLILWLALSLNSMVYYFVLSWLPLILVRIGARQEDAILASSLINLSGMAAAFITGPLMDRFGGYRVVALHFVFGAVCAVIVGAVLTPVAVVIVPAALCLGFCVSGLQKGITALTMHFYPTEIRSSGLGFVLGVGRSGAVAGPALAGFLMAAGWPPAAIFFFMAVPMITGAAIVLFMARYYSPASRGRRARRDTAVDVTANLA